MNKIELGQKAKDTVTGYTGIVTAKTTWLYGCTRFALQTPLDKDGKVPEPQWFDELQLVGAEPDRTKGGPQPAPRRNADPSR